MRARHRHFNPAHAGAAAAYDSRYISFSNGAEVDTWTSRTGANNATQSISANRPLYRASEINGQPAVEFDGSNDQLATSSVVTASTSYTIYLFIRNDSTSGTRVYFYNGSTGSNGFGYIRSGSTRSLLHGGSRDNTFGNTTTSWELWSGSGTSGQLPSAWVNGSNQTVTPSSAVTAVNAATTTTRIGADPSNFFTDGMIASAIMFGSELGAPLRRRVEQSVAMSFKHAIS